jgi:hypothetical protein
MIDDRQSAPPKSVHRLQAVLALLRGEAMETVTTQYQIGRSDLYKFRARALAVMRATLNDHPRGPRRPHNRLAPQREQRVVALCQRHPILSSYQVGQRLGPDSPSPRTIQRVRKRYGIARLPKRAPPTVPRRVVSTPVKERAAQRIQEQWHLGPERISWDLQNGEGLTVSPSTVKRLKRTIHEALYLAPLPPVWRFYERHHPHSLWHG